MQSQQSCGAGKQGEQKLEGTTGRKAFSIDEFCKLHSISRALLYKEWAAGRGPRAMKVGARTLISAEAAEAWRRSTEAEAEDDAA
jgi:hypothetical protein